MTRLRDELLRFVDELRARGVRVSVAETMDAMNAVAAAGIERVRMREALAATLVKDEADRPVFDELFTRFFAFGRVRADGLQHKPGEQSRLSAGSGKGPGQPLPTGRSREEPRPGETAKPGEPRAKLSLAKKAQPSNEHGDTTDAESGHDRSAAEHEQARGGIEAGVAVRMRALERTAFARYSELEYEEALGALASIARRFRVRLGRRLKRARSGRLDFRQTIRASIQRGGALCDLRFRSRRPRHIDLVVLADVSGSVRYSSSLMLALMVGARQFFRRFRSFVYIDRLAEADFEDGHLVTETPLDFYARSDFGRVLHQLWERRAELFSRATVLVIMGDGRNNRRPARADILRELAGISRAVLWLIPEERERWGTGDSAIFQYARELTALLPARNLRELEEVLLKVA